MTAWATIAIPLFMASAAPGDQVVRSWEQSDVLTSLAPMSEGELQEQRGGFLWEGLQIGLGAEVRSYLDGRLVMQTNFTLGEGLGERTQWVSSDLAKSTAAALASAEREQSSIRLTSGGGEVYFANEGRTAFVINDAAALSQMVLNTASGTSIRQETDIVLDLKNFGPLEAQLRAATIGEGVAGLGAIIPSLGR